MIPKPEWLSSPVIIDTAGAKEYKKRKSIGSNKTPKKKKRK